MSKKRVSRFFGSVKDYEMEMFGEKYDLSKCTPEEAAAVEVWYDKNKQEDVSSAADSPSGRMITEDKRSKFEKPSDELSFELAIESLKGNNSFNPPMQGKEKYIQLYRMVHPLGGNMKLDDAAKILGINRVTAFRWLKRLKTLNPEVYDLDKWPTKAQTDVYRLIHPDLGGLTYREAAKALGCPYQSVCGLMARMRKTHPEAFAFERLARPTVVRYDPNVHEDVAEKL